MSETLEVDDNADVWELTCASLAHAFGIKDPEPVDDVVEAADEIDAALARFMAAVDSMS